LWSGFSDLALAHGLRACWSAPILATEDRVLGTFAMYYREARVPCDADLELIEIATRISGIAIERTRSEEALRRSEGRYRDLFENANDLVATVDLEHRFTSVNGAFERVLGYTRDELIGMRLDELLPPASQDLARRELARKLDAEASEATYEHELVAKDGRTVTV